MSEQQQTVGPNQYRCAHCGGIFDKGWSDEEAWAEHTAKFGDTFKPEQTDVICDDCFKAMGGDQPDFHDRNIALAAAFIRQTVQNAMDAVLAQSHNPALLISDAIAAVTREIHHLEEFDLAEHVEITTKPGPERTVLMNMKALTPFGSSIIYRMMGENDPPRWVKFEMTLPGEDVTNIAMNQPEDDAS